MAVSDEALQGAIVPALEAVVASCAGADGLVDDSMVSSSEACELAVEALYNLDSKQACSKVAQDVVYESNPTMVAQLKSLGRLFAAYFVKKGDETAQVEAALMQVETIKTQCYGLRKKQIYLSSNYSESTFIFF